MSGRAGARAGTDAARPPLGDRPGRGRRRGLRPWATLAARALLVVFVVGAAGLTLGERPLDTTYRLGDLLRAALDLTPVSSDRLDDGRVEFVANVLLFLPLGVLLPLALPRVPLTVLLAVPLAASLAVEVAQLLVVSGRTPDVSDLAANGTGGAFGILLGADLLRALRWWDHRRGRAGG